MKCHWISNYSPSYGSSSCEAGEALQIHRPCRKHETPEGLCPQAAGLKPQRVHLAPLRQSTPGQMFLWKWPVVCFSSASPPSTHTHTHTHTHIRQFAAVFCWFPLDLYITRMGTRYSAYLRISQDWEHFGISCMPIG